MKKIFNNSIGMNNLNEVVELYGWVSKIRKLGGLIFIDLRDRSGIVQVVVRPENDYYEEASKLKSEFVIKVIGTVVERENKNKNIPTGDIEIDLSKLEVLNKSLDLPFTITDEVTALENTRLKYRYLDLRRPELKEILLLRHRVTTIIRNYMNDNSFIEVETPILCKSTPEGARDFLVPSRINKGSFYALPQSPQLLKQLLMVSGIERYYQLAKCFRDEDLRSDRQPEFTQLDLEMSFVEEEDIISLVEGLIKEIFEKEKGMDVKLPLQRMKYDEAIDKYGSDKPDLRFGMEIKDLTNIFKETDFVPFNNSLDNNGIINAIVVKDKSDKYSRKDLDKLNDFVKDFTKGNVFYLKYNDNTFSGSISKILDEGLEKELVNELKLTSNDLVLIMTGTKKEVKASLGALRCKVARDMNMIAKEDYKMLWVTDFPSFEYSEEEKRYVACHHPFTAPKDSDVDKLLTDKGNCYSKAYDIVINGYEVGGGSIRIHDEEIQNKMFEALNLTKEDIEGKFGFFVNALKYGTPPHGGLAIGLERLIMILAGTDNIKDVIAFPKTQSGADLMCESPSTVDEKQLDELDLRLK